MEESFERTLILDVPIQNYEYNWYIVPTNISKRVIQQYRRYKELSKIQRFGPGYSLKTSRIDISGTGNCQFSVVSQAHNLITNPIDEVKILFREIYKSISCKPMLLLDLNQLYTKNVEAIFTPELIYNKSEYTSTNGSKMVLWLVKISEL